MKTPNHIKYYLKAKTAEGLRAKMAKNSIDANTYYGYTIIYAEGFWFAWFEDLVDREMKKDDTIDGDQG